MKSATIPTQWLTFSSCFNSNLAAVRRENSQGLYDIHTNAIQWPKAMQPTHARWENVERQTNHGKEEAKKELANIASNDQENVDQELSSIFKELKPIYPRNFMIHDLALEGAPESTFGPPGLDHDPQSLSSIPATILDELPAECRQAFEEAKARELAWKSKWTTESVDGKRGVFMPTVEWFP